MFNNDHSGNPLPRLSPQGARMNTSQSAIVNPPQNTLVHSNLTWNESSHPTPSMSMYTSSAMTMTFPTFDTGPSTSSGVYHHQSMFQFPPYHVPFDYQQVKRLYNILSSDEIIEARYKKVSTEFNLLLRDIRKTFEVWIFRKTGSSDHDNPETTSQ